jgi:hypothetical protein
MAALALALIALATGLLVAPALDLLAVGAPDVTRIAGGSGP